MPPLQTPICDFNKSAFDFKLKSTENKLISLNNIKGSKGTLVMFICNHCPYVKAIIKDLVDDCNELKKIGINAVAISANDPTNYPEDSFENMINFANENNFGFPYLYDETQEIAKIYGAVCTPDFFGYNQDLKLQYRGRIMELKNLVPVRDKDSELKLAMQAIAETGQGPRKQIPSIGCSIKWKNN
jgi:peroxiredoxin